jgi:hypothetical protein
MDSAEIINSISATLPQLEVSGTEDLINVFIPALDDTVNLPPGRVLRIQAIFGPRGERAIEFTMTDDEDPWPFILTADDVVYPPADTSTVLDSAIQIKISNAPPLVAYSEMTRDALAYAQSCESSETLDLDGAVGTEILLRCFIAGATRLGMFPTQAAACWLRARAALGGETFLAEYRPDPAWEELCARARTTRVTFPPEPIADDPRNLTADDFREVAPRLTFSRLDDELVTSWKRWVPITPQRFTRILLDGLDDAQAELTLYPDGGGEIMLRVRAGGENAGVLQLGMSFANDQFTLDEIRIEGAGKGTGLFQRLIYNTDELAGRLGFSAIRTVATGIGSYALAALGYPKDRETWIRLNRGQS